MTMAGRMMDQMLDVAGMLGGAGACTVGAEVRGHVGGLWGLIAA